MTLNPMVASLISAAPARAAANLDLAPIGNCSVSALVDREGRFVWSCYPRVDGDPVFCALLKGEAPDIGAHDGQWSIEMEDMATVEQDYVRNTAVLRTILTDVRGAKLQIVDAVPRYWRTGRIYRPTAFVRIVKPLNGAPRIRIRLRPTDNWGENRCDRTWGSNHIRFSGENVRLRLTASCPVTHVVEERLFRLEEEIALFLGPDEPFVGDVLMVAREMIQQTETYWRHWVRTLTVPLDWQSAVIRAAITLKLCAYEETGAIVAALTTSIPEAAGSGRNWDYRYCWLRDAYYVVQALNRLGAADLLENYLGFLRNLVDQSKDGHIQPVYGVGLEDDLTERVVETLPGYRGMGPVRAGNQAYEQIQHDVYGQIVLSNTQAFFDQRLYRPATIADFEALETVGDRAFAVHDKPDAGLWEFRTRSSVHTYSSVMCWAACDRLSNAALVLGLADRSAFWLERAGMVRAKIEAEAWNADIGRFAASFGGAELDASLLQMVDLHFLEADDPRYQATFKAVEQGLRRGNDLLRYDQPDDFGEPETAFNFCTFWYIEALHFDGRTDEARTLFEQMLARRTHAGLLSEDITFSDGELWGNYPQTYSLVGLINCATLLSRPWSAVR
jgi:GH15 family glucan-1,4-alpha-glucosidase